MEVKTQEQVLRALYLDEHPAGSSGNSDWSVNSNLEL